MELFPNNETSKYTVAKNVTRRKARFSGLVKKR